MPRPYNPNPQPLKDYLRPFRQCINCGILLAKNNEQGHCHNRFCQEYAAQLQAGPVRAVAITR
jgi:hypothetical protein